MSSRSVLPAVLLAALPAATSADRGALTLEGGPLLTVVSAGPSAGSGPSSLGTSAGALLGVRYGLRNGLELAASALWEAPADYFHDGADLTGPTGPLRGTFTERGQRLGALAGLRLVRGYVWRLHAGLDVGWTRERFSRRDLLDVSDPANPHSFGLGLKDRATNAFVLSPLAGVEWQLTDHWTATASVRAAVGFGAEHRVAVTVPVTIGYSWYVY